MVVYLCWLEWYDMCPFTFESHLSPFDIKSIHILTCMEMDLKVLFKLNITILGVTLLFLKHICFCNQVMEQCVARLDVAMFNAILRESANEIPTDPVSDPIVDSKVLPIPAGDLSFGSGAQLKNSVSTISSCYVPVDY